MQRDGFAERHHRHCDERP
ncbi:hypothetical protein [Caballeronia sp. PC1]